MLYVEIFDVFKKVYIRASLFLQKSIIKKSIKFSSISPFRSFDPHPPRLLHITE